MSVRFGAAVAVSAWVGQAQDLFLGQETASAEEPVWDADLYLHDEATVEMFNAKCLDGSPGGFYYRKASTPSAATKWKFHFMGGGWCDSANDCKNRAQGLLGSSKPWTPKLSNLWSNNAAFYGLMSAEVNETGQNVGNPFGDWNFVWLAYCDGSSQTSNRDEPLNVGGTPIYMRGRAVLDAHLYELEKKFKFLSSATEVIISGTSAGGMSTFMHSSFIKSQLKAPNAKLVAVPDAGFWWDTLKYGSANERPWLDRMEKSIVSDVWNATLRGNLATCLDDKAAADQAKCYSQPYAYAYLDVPTFVIQSLSDPSNFGFCWGPPCKIKGNSPGSCSTDQLAHFAEYSANLRENITKAQEDFGHRDGHFLTACNQHEESCRQYDWWGITIDGQTMNSTFTTWYNHGGAAPGAKAVDVPWPGDTTCREMGHGSC